MVTAGIDVGLENIKVVILKDGKIIGRAKGRTGGARRRTAIEQIYHEALKDAGLAASDINKAIATGMGRHDVGFADDRVTQVVTAARAARFLCPGVTMVVDIGADETLVATLGEGARIKEFSINQKCAAGLGTFLRYMARRLELTMEDMGQLNMGEGPKAAVNDGCVVFAELDALSLLNRGMSPREVGMAVTRAAAVRVCSVLNYITVPARECAVLFGGLTKNAAFVGALKAFSDIDFVIPEESEYAGALGAALSAAELPQADLNI
jgi:predicted CoA-substrate-specific enzyme activase